MSPGLYLAAEDHDLLLGALTGAFPVVVFELDPQGVFLSEAGAGRSRVLERYADSDGSPVGRSALELYADAPQVVANLHRALAGEAFVGRVEVPRPAEDGGPDGTPAVFEVVYNPVFDRHGQLERLVGVALDVTEREAAARRAIADAERLRRLAARLQTEREAERTRVARAVHDAVGQALVAIGFDARALLRALGSERASGRPLDREALRRRLGEVIELADTSLEAVGDLAAELRPPLLDALGLSAALADAAERFAARTGYSCALEAPLSSADERLVGQARATTAFRIAQEALANVARHAGPCAVRLRLRVADPTTDVHGELPGRHARRGGAAREGKAELGSAAGLGQALVVEVEDDGCGVPNGAAGAGTPGLSGMAERAAQWGGTLYVGPPSPVASSPETASQGRPPDAGRLPDATRERRGTLVRATIPLGPEGPEDR